MNTREKARFARLPLDFCALRVRAMSGVRWVRIFLFTSYLNIQYVYCLYISLKTPLKISTPLNKMVEHRALTWQFPFKRTSDFNLDDDAFIFNSRWSMLSALSDHWVLFALSLSSLHMQNAVTIIFRKGLLQSPKVAIYKATKKNAIWPKYPSTPRVWE